MLSTASQIVLRNGWIECILQLKIFPLFEINISTAAIFKATNFQCLARQLSKSMAYPIMIRDLETLLNILRSKFD
jgi:hypothetical protein